VRCTTGEPWNFGCPIGKKGWTGEEACGDLAIRLRGTISVEEAMCGRPLLQLRTRRNIASVAETWSAGGEEDRTAPICMRPAFDAACSQARRRGR
jgi:hypothetical protein